MKPIPTLFLRRGELPTKPVPGDDPGGEHVITDQVRPGCEWVLEGKGVATRQWDGLCCLVKDGKLWKRQICGDIYLEARYELDFGKFVTRDRYGRAIFWVPVSYYPVDALYREAWLSFIKDKEWGATPTQGPALTFDDCDGTYELCGPAINGNPEGFSTHVLIRHGDEVMHRNCTYHYRHWITYFEKNDIEGLVWWHKDDERLPYHERRLAKIKRTDFGLKWPT